MPRHLSILDRLLGFWKSLKQAVKKMSQFVLSDPQIPPRRSIAPSLSDDVDLQTQSPLFNAIPAEIRNRIFSIALSAYDDKTKPYGPQNWFYRPDWHFHPKISTTLLRTCKRIYLECHLLPLALNSHTFWAGVDRGPPSHYFVGAYKQPLPSGRGRLHGNWNACENYRGFFNKLTAEQRGAVGELHFFFQQFYLESVKFSPPLDPESSRPIAARKLKVTMRHQDWYWWERNEKLGLCPWNRGRTLWNQMDTPMPKTRMELVASQGWGAQLQYIQGLQEFELEMETLIEKKWQMDGIVERAKRWIFPLKDDKVLRWDNGAGIKESRWEEDDVSLNPQVPLLDGEAPLSTEKVMMLSSSGSAGHNATAGTPSQSNTVSQAGSQIGPALPAPAIVPVFAKRQYYVVSLTWKVRAGEEEELQSGSETAVE
jgi:hypothetical protein